MQTTNTFTTQELQLLINKSKAMARLSQEMRMQIFSRITSTESLEAQRLYQILSEERQEYRRIQEDYLTNSNKIIAEFQIKITAENTEKLRSEQQKAESRAKLAEDKAAEKLIQSLN
ncbi:hypothetical protein IT412_02035 [Candidatus Peregrinibacteria bacterium]|nr:hypothetical protein [Candidatus Peregrinibacteria bacterium]